MGNVKRTKKVKIGGATISAEADIKRQELMANGIVLSWLIEKAINECWEMEIGMYQVQPDTGISDAEEMVLRAIHDSEENA